MTKDLWYIAVTLTLNERAEPIYFWEHFLFCLLAINNSGEKKIQKINAFYYHSYVTQISNL